MDTGLEQNAVTMSEILDTMIKEEKEAANYLSKSESNECSYGKGYITQTAFGCFTCDKTAGMCLGCYLNCHLEHETFEIGLKRNFRCDCGTGAFGDHPCTLNSDKSGLNNKNKYDHNFEGKWCICNSKYDPNLFMIRCLQCLDYYHLHHLNLSEDTQNAIEDDESLTMMICPKCLDQKYKFLLCYQDQTILFKPEDFIANKFNNEQPEGTTELGKRSRSTEEPCTIIERTKQMNSTIDTPAFLKDGWNNNLCYCEQCQDYYKESGVYEIIIDQEEEEAEEEKMNEPEHPSTAETSFTIQEEPTLYNQGLKEISKLDFMTQSVFASLYRDFYDDFKTFLAQFKDENKIVTADHIAEFFAKLKEKKKDIVYD